MRLFLFPVDERDVSCYVTEMLAIREQRLRLSVPVLPIIMSCMLSVSVL